MLSFEVELLIRLITITIIAIKVTDEGARPRDFFKKELKDESISKKNFTAFC